MRYLVVFITVTQLLIRNRRNLPKIPFVIITAYNLPKIPFVIFTVYYLLIMNRNRKNLHSLEIVVRNLIYLQQWRSKVTLQINYMYSPHEQLSVYIVSLINKWM